MIILCQGKVYHTVDAIFPRCGALLLTRDHRSGVSNVGFAAPLDARSEVFDFVASPSAASAPKHNLSRVPLHLTAHDMDFGLCTSRV